MEVPRLGMIEGVGSARRRGVVARRLISKVGESETIWIEHGRCESPLLVVAAGRGIQVLEFVVLARAIVPAQNDELARKQCPAANRLECANDAVRATIILAMAVDAGQWRVRSKRARSDNCGREPAPRSQGLDLTNVPRRHGNIEGVRQRRRAMGQLCLSSGCR